MRFVIICIAICIQSFVTAQSFGAFADKTEIALDQYIEVEFRLENANAKQFVPPDFVGWTKIQGPATSTSVSIINGQRSSSVSYIYTLSPKNVGTLTIGKAEVKLGNKSLYSDPITVKVSKSSPQGNINGNEAKSLSKKDIFIIAKATPEKAYVGQQIVTEYKLYTAVDVENYNIIHTPDHKGFHLNHIPRLQYDNRETINGKTYITKIIQAASIYPIQYGKFEIEPLHARASVVVDDGRSNPNSFFLLPTTEGVNLVSNKLNIEVLPLPEPAPPYYSGAVGKFTITSRIDQSTAKVNDAISVALYIEGDGDLNRVGKPFLNLDTSAFQLYEPKVTKENVDYKMTGFIGMRELLYPIVAIKPGVHKIIPSFIYFNSDSQKYVTLAPEIYNVNISGTANNTKNNLGDPTNKEITKELQLIKNPSIGKDKFIGSPIYYLSLILPLLSWLGLFIVKKKKSKYEALHADSIRMNQEKKARLEILTSLDAKSNFTKADADTAFDNLQNHLMQYFGIADQISKSDWYQKIKNANMDETIKSKINSVFNTAEMALYGGQLSNIQVKEMIKNSKEVIEKL